MISVEQILEKSKSLYDFHFGQRPYGCYRVLCPTYSSSDLMLEFPVETALSKTDLWKFDMEYLTWRPSGGRILVFNKDDVVDSSVTKPKSVADFFFNREKFKELGVKLKIPHGRDFVDFNCLNDAQFSPVVRLLWFLGKTKAEVDTKFTRGLPWEFYLFYFALTRSNRDLEVLKKADWKPWNDDEIDIDYPTFSNFKKFYYDLYRKLTKTKEDRDKSLFSSHLWCIYRGMRGDLPDGIPLGGKRLRIGGAKSAQEACDYLYNIYCKSGLTDTEATTIRRERSFEIHPLWGTW